MRRHLTYSNIVASLALFLALGGTSYAVATGSIGSRELRNNSVRGKDIRNGQVTTRDVKDRSLLAADFGSGQLPAGPRGAAGPAGARGEQGPAGPTYRALVKSDGSLADGNATGATRIGLGEYDVRFGRAVAGCSVSAGPTVFPGFGSAALRVSPYFSLGVNGADANEVRVDFFDTTDGTIRDTAFSMMLACP